ncbi:30S ribosomal protein S9 [Patescibacteria group bacterium]|nr:30S ribosomal protein S9 [Patescibacteria group bacterium]
MVNEDQNLVKAVGRRKTSACRVRLTLGKGEIVINGKTLVDYFSIPLWSDKVLAPLKAVGKEKDFDVNVKVVGGGINSQADAVRHGISRALVKWNEDWKPVLKAEGYMTRDPRAKERKKPGLHRARRAHQWRKR